ncbi:MAG: glycerate kinase [Bacteroidota bacterium]
MKRGKVIIAPNAFKGSLSAAEAASAIRNGLLRVGLREEDLIEIPIADGGDGSLDVLAKYLDLEIMRSKVNGPLWEEVAANWGFNRERKIAVIEMAEASGIKLLSKDELNPMLASSYGTGELIKEALSMGLKEIYLTVGGSATVDLGIGLMEALGIKFYAGRKEVKHVSPNDFLSIDSIDLSGYPQSSGIKIRILSDVTNPLLGPQGAAVVFGPQKGADQETVRKLEERLAHVANLLEQTSGKSIREMVGGGAAGGVTAGLHAAMGAEVIDGAEQILSWAAFDKYLEEAALLITGEGKIDTQTNYGKGPGLVARKAKEKGIRVVGLSGILDDDISGIKNFDQLIRISDPNDSLEESMRKTAENLERVVSLVIL